MRHTDKVLGNPGREAWEEAGGGRRREPAAGALRVQPRRLCLVWLRKACVTGLASALLGSAGLGSWKAGSPARVLPREGQHISKNSSPVT